ncbi:MAG: hypothetical protein ACREJV_09285 [Candidatus Rokuibacteriota bacterium]
MRYHRGAALLVALALASLVLAAATVPHTHVTSQPGLFNQEHDLSYLAALGGVAPLVQVIDAVAPVVVVAATPVAPAPPLASRPGRHQNPRAPPLR